MSANSLDESFDDIARVSPPRVVAPSLTNAGFTSLLTGITAPVGARRFYLTLGACGQAYELRLHADDTTGIVVPANTVFTYPFPLSVDCAPAGKLSVAGPATLSVMVAYPDT